MPLPYRPPLFLPQVPSGLPLLVIGQEMLDALPIHQFEFTPKVEEEGGGRRRRRRRRRIIKGEEVHKISRQTRAQQGLPLLSESRPYPPATAVSPLPLFVSSYFSPR